MRSEKCKMCGKYKPLYGGICTECKTLRAYEINKKIQEEVYESEFHNEDENAFAGFSNFCLKEMEREVKEEDEYEKYLSMSDEEKKRWEFNKICELNYINKETQLQYKPQLLQIFKNYRSYLLDQDVQICTKKEYERTGSGEVCDIIGNFVIRRFTNKKEDGVEVNRSILVDTDSLLKYLLGEVSLEDLKGDDLKDIIIDDDNDEMNVEIEDVEVYDGIELNDIDEDYLDETDSEDEE